ncbi:hypothetical protein RvY_16240 [Ramazzottius varieornatus]|uniref:N-acetyltransferase domain-containing protein n=1 Tax=Ramazzottius varieornatus TaxID=947166 RepID=A0A1D1W280_RAMVA|nr:hypothetical protein RvY_16240 [Ramazzottius varieornatus]
MSQDSRKPPQSSQVLSSSPNPLYPNLQYRRDYPITVIRAIELYNASGLTRPVEDVARIQAMYDNSNLVVSVWDEDRLVGVARSVTDFVYCCYLSDLAVRKDYQKGGIGKELIRLTKEIVGEQSNLMLLAVDTAMEYYPKIGMSPIKNGFILFRDKN